MLPGRCLRINRTLTLFYSAVLRILCVSLTAAHAIIHNANLGVDNYVLIIHSIRQVAHV